MSIVGQATFPQYLSYSTISSTIEDIHEYNNSSNAFESLPLRCSRMQETTALVRNYPLGAISDLHIMCLQLIIIDF